MNENERIYAISQDPIYIGTGGFTIGRVDNTIVRDPITKIPKIPGTSVAGTWRYYMVLTLNSYFKEEYRISRKERKDKTINELFNKTAKNWAINFAGNRYAAIKCAGQDDTPNLTIKDAKENSSGHCGHCMVCKTFGFSKRDSSQRGMAYFSDLNILFFPVYTRLGTRWITSREILNSADIKIKSTSEFKDFKDDEVLVYKKNDKSVGNSINLGWLNFKAINTIDDINTNNNKNVANNKDTANNKNLLERFSEFNIKKEKIILVSDNIINQVINSNLETRTSVSIDPLTGAAKEKALFTSEAIPRGTVFYGDIRVEKHPLKEEPDEMQVLNALKDSKRYFENLGIGGMTTRGFGRLKIFDWSEEK